MWKLIPRPVRRWALLAVAVPVGAWLLDQAAEVIASSSDSRVRASTLRKNPFIFENACSIGLKSGE